MTRAFFALAVAGLVYAAAPGITQASPLVPSQEGLRTLAPNFLQDVRWRRCWRDRWGRLHCRWCWRDRWGRVICR
jgi:hypothetical protein